MPVLRQKHQTWFVIDDVYNNVFFWMVFLLVFPKEFTQMQRLFALKCGEGFSFSMFWIFLCIYLPQPRPSLHARPFQQLGFCPWWYFQERLSWLDCSDWCRSHEVPVPLNCFSSLGRRETSWEAGRGVVVTQGGLYASRAPALSHSRLSLSLSAWISCQPVTHQVATHQPLTGRLTHLWERISESGEWPGIAAPSGAEPPTCDLSLFGNCLPSSAVLFLHWLTCCLCFIFHPWSMVIGQLVIEIYVKDKKVFANVTLH